MPKYEFRLPSLSLPASCLLKGACDPEEKNSSCLSWDFEVFKKYLYNLKPSQAKSFLLKVLTKEWLIQQQEALRREYKEPFKNKGEVQNLLKAILGAREYALKKLHGTPPKDLTEAFACISETQKRIHFMMQIETILGHVLMDETCVQEHGNFLLALAEDIEINFNNMMSAFDIYTKAHPKDLVSFFEQNQITIDLLVKSITLSLRKNDHDKYQRDRLLDKLQFLVTHYQHRPIFQGVLKHDPDEIGVDLVIRQRWRQQLEASQEREERLRIQKAELRKQVQTLKGLLYSYHNDLEILNRQIKQLQDQLDQQVLMAYVPVYEQVPYGYPAPIIFQDPTYPEPPISYPPEPTPTFTRLVKFGPPSPKVS